MKFLKGLWKFVNSKIFGYILLAVFVALFIGTCGRNANLKDESDRKDQNISVLNDSIEMVRQKNGELQASRNAYMADAKELREYNKELADEVKRQKGKVVTLNRIVFRLIQDTTELRKYIRELEKEEPKQINDSTWAVPWTLYYVYDSTNYDLFKGETRVGLIGPSSYFPEIKITHNGTEMLDRDSQIGMTWGQKYENGRLRVYAQTAHPAFRAKLLEGTYVDYPKERKWFTGFGIGPTLNVGYDFLHNQPAVIIGVGVHYNIYEF